MAKKIIFSIVFIISLSGCSLLTVKDETSSGTHNTLVSEERTFDEELLIKSKNYKKLIDLYKSRLSEEDDFETRIKLANVYLEKKDPESAIFVLSNVDKNVSSYKLSYIRASAYYDLQKYALAQNSVKKALELEPNNPEALNLSGILYAEIGDLESARDMFNNARMNMFDDVKIKINLSMIDLFEENYKQVIDRLMPLYTSGFSDSEEAKPIFAIALAKERKKAILYDLFLDDYKRKEIEGIYKYLSTMQYYDVVKSIR